MEDSVNGPFRVVFVLGGPGAGKGTLCQALVSDSQANPKAMHDFIHLSVGDVLRAEVKRPNSRYGAIIEDNMLHGRVGPKEITVELLRNAMLQELSKISQGTKLTSRKEVFLIDGFPRKMDQALFFEQVISHPLMVIMLHVAEEELKARLKLRSSTELRFDDNDDSISKRIATFHSVTSDVVNYYDAMGKIRIVDGSGSKEDVFKELTLVLSNVLGDC